MPLADRKGTLSEPSSRSPGVRSSCFFIRDCLGEEKVLQRLALVTAGVSLPAVCYVYDPRLPSSPSFLLWRRWWSVEEPPPDQVLCLLLQPLSFTFFALPLPDVLHHQRDEISVDLILDLLSTGFFALMILQRNM